MVDKTRVITLAEAKLAFLAAYSASLDWNNVLLSLAESGNTNAASTAFGIGEPIFASDGSWVNRFAWRRDFRIILQLHNTWLSGIGNGPVWVDRLNGDYLTRPTGPFGRKSFADRFYFELDARALGQHKARRSGVWRSGALKDTDVRRVPVRV